MVINLFATDVIINGMACIVMLVNVAPFHVTKPTIAINLKSWLFILGIHHSYYSTVHYILYILCTSIIVNRYWCKFTVQRNVIINFVYAIIVIYQRNVI